MTAQDRARLRRVFISYKHSDRDVAEAVARALASDGIGFSTDWNSRQSLRRWFGTRRGDQNEGGLDSWLRSNLFWSDSVIVLKPLAEFLSAFTIDSDDEGKPFLDVLVNRQLAVKLYRDANIAYYLSHPRRWWQNEYYAWCLGTRIGKDRLEGWRHWEMRVGSAIGLPVLVAVVADENCASDSIENLIADGIRWSNVNPECFAEINFANICLLRKQSLVTDIDERCIPGLLAAAHEAPSARRRRLWKLRFAIARLLSPLAAMLFVTFVLIFVLVLDVFSLLWSGIRSLLRIDSHKT